MVIAAFRLVLLLCTATISAGLVYHYLLLVAGCLQPKSRTIADKKAVLRFAIAIPAHNEADVIGATVQQLHRMAYPTGRFDTHIVADYCTDDTVAAAQAAGAEVHVRNDGPRGRKGYAVDWLIQRLLADPRGYDAIVIFDADSRVDTGFLMEVIPYLTTGAQVVQGRHVIANPKSSRFAALADADMRLNNHIRNQAKENLGLSARLMGDAMVFRREVLERYPWIGAGSLTEDRDYGIYLVTQGVRIRFAPAAISTGQAVTRWKDATPQRLRWYGGAFDLQRRYVRKLASRAVRLGELDALDKLLELTLPPFSLLVMGSVLLLIAQMLLNWLGEQSMIWPVISMGLVGLAGLFPFLGLAATGAPRADYSALLVGPFYVLWRVKIALSVRLRPGRVTWVRTRHVGD